MICCSITEKKLVSSSPKHTLDCTRGSRGYTGSHHLLQICWIWLHLQLKLEVLKHFLEWETSLSCPTTQQWADEAVFIFKCCISLRARDCTLGEMLWWPELNKPDYPIVLVMLWSHSVTMLHRQKLPAAQSTGSAGLAAGPLWLRQKKGQKYVENVH